MNTLDLLKKLAEQQPEKVGRRRTNEPPVFEAPPRREQPSRRAPLRPARAKLDKDGNPNKYCAPAKSYPVAARPREVVTERIQIETGGQL